MELFTRCVVSEKESATCFTLSVEIVYNYAHIFKIIL